VAVPGLADPYERLKKVIEKIDEDTDPTDREHEIEDAWRLVQGALLRTLLPALRILTQDAPKTFRSGQITWLASLQRSQRQLHETTTNPNLRPLRRGMAGLEPVIDTAMVQVNTTLFNTASNVPLGVLVEELDSIADLLRSADLPPDQVRRLQVFERGIVALQ